MKFKIIIFPIIILGFLVPNKLIGQIEYDTTYQVSVQGDSLQLVTEKPLYTYEDTLNKRVNFYLKVVNDTTEKRFARFFAANKLLQYPNKFFNQPQKELLKSAIYDSLLISNALILLAGKVGINDDITYKKLSKYITVDSVGNFNNQPYAYSLEWCIHLAYAKMGFQKHIKHVINLAKNEKDKSVLVRVIYNQLFYIGNQKAIDLFSDFVFSEETFDYIDEGSGFGYIPRRVYIPIAYSAYKQLSKLVADFPEEVCEEFSGDIRLNMRIVKCKYNLESLEIVRAWVKENQFNYTMNKNYDKIFRTTFFLSVGDYGL